MSISVLFEQSFFFFFFWGGGGGGGGFSIAQLVKGSDSAVLGRGREFESHDG